MVKVRNMFGQLIDAKRARMICLNQEDHRSNFFDKHQLVEGFFVLTAPKHHHQDVFRREAFLFVTLQHSPLASLSHTIAAGLCPTSKKILSPLKLAGYSSSGNSSILHGARASKPCAIELGGIVTKHSSSFFTAFLSE